jgi:hypothetical protein
MDTDVPGASALRPVCLGGAFLPINVGQNLPKGHEIMDLLFNVKEQQDPREDYIVITGQILRSTSVTDHPYSSSVGALSSEFNILPCRWQHVWLVAIVPPERWGKMDRNDCHTA